MKTVFVFMAMLMVVIPLNSQSWRFMTYNIRYDNPGDGADAWAARNEAVVNLIKHYHPLVLGIQEGLAHQVAYLDSNLTNYAYVGVGRDDGKEKGEFSAIFYDTTLLEVLERNTFWLSDTPDKVSKGWDAALERVCTYALFRIKERGQKFWVFNTHYDHIGQQARASSSQLIGEMIIRKTQEEAFPVVLMGDFNATPDETPIKIIQSYLKDTYENSPSHSYGPQGTFWGFELDALAERRIDYIFCKDCQVEAHSHIDDRRPNNRHISDHLPVLVELSW
ncbi:MAG TPA: endonuclease/exonuclease/phosphatase family protein [Saprospiraceae bacterium]|nr:endonuclease/exonuclease/phosphatase family protein [Saprospiraceae bacterium]HMQ82660.1 endonuclease/exonuclease/phosphatase family protein [Saprospiraceae bacterium]